MRLKNRLKVAGQLILGKKLDAARIVTELTDLGSSQIGLFGGLGGMPEENNRKQKFEQVSIKELLDEDLDTLIPKVIKSDPAIDQAYDFFCTLTTQGSSMTAETDRAEREIQEINEILKERNNPLELCVAHCASSLIMRGDITAETEFSDNLEILNLWINDPTWVEWRLIEEEGTTVWKLGTYKNAKWEQIDSPNVYYLAGNPLVGERSSRSPVQTALFPAISQTAMIKSLQSIIDIHAWAQTLFSIQKLEMIKIQNDGGEIDDVDGQVQSAKELINKVLAKKKPEQIMGMTDDIKPLELSGGGDKYTFTSEIGNLYDKRTAMGSKTPATIGGQQQRADYSTRQQNLFYSVYLQSGQERIAHAMEWGYKRFLISRGVVDDPIYTSKSMNVESRLIEAEAFQEIMEGLNKATQSGMSLPAAIEFFEEESGTKFSAKLKATIQKDYEEQKELMMSMPNNPLARNNRNNQNNTNNDDDSNSTEDSEGNLGSPERETQDNSHIITAGASYLEKRILQRISKNANNGSPN